ncbi:MAG: ABC-2 family transporter protein [Nitrospinae bacterium]|nr:ABC-2 family transporter protein [Nitrospinota bacterium]
MMRDLPIYLTMMLAAIRAKMEYRVTFLFLFFALVTFYLGQLGTVLVVIDRFGSINGWTLGEMAFLYGLMVFSQSITTFFFASLVNFEGLIMQGGFDRYLLRPLDPLPQLIASQFEVSSIAHLVIGVSALVYGAAGTDIAWSAGKVAFFFVVVAGAVMIQGGVRLGVSAICFWTMRNRSLVHILVFSSKEFILYPVSIFNYWIQVFLTLVFPLAFVNFYPSHVFLNRDASNLLFSPLIQYATPVAGVVFFSLAYLLWRAGINHYQSTGS